MRVSGPSSTKILLPALLAMATLTLQGQQPQTTPTGSPTSTTTPGSAPTTPPTMPPAQTPSNPQSTPTASTQPTATPCDTEKDNGKKKDKKDKKKGKNDKDEACQPSQEEMAAAQDTAIRARKNTAPEPGPNGVMPGVKQGSIDDVSATGTREIGGRGLGNWYSTESEMKEGKGVSMEIEKSVKFINDPVVTEYVNRIGQNIVKNSDAKVPFTIRVIDSDEINAMALPGGFFYVNSGLILNADEEAELAGVMAHETAHVCAHHAVREQTRMNYAQLGTIPLIMMTGYSWTGYGIYEATQFAVPLTFLKFSRDFEAQADFLGIQYMYRSGYDPQAFISFFEKVQALEKRKPGLVAKAFSDHPQTPDRISHSQEEIARILPARDEYTVTTSEFDDVKARLARIENKRRLLDTKDKNKPSLRRASTTDDKNGQAGQSGNSGDDRPTLHRRDDQQQ
jgi:beta-barrel assembly-enhancing protease